MVVYRLKKYVNWMRQTKPRKLLIIGPIFNSQSGPTGQGGKLFVELTKYKDFEITKASHIRNKYLRFLHIIIMVLQPYKYDTVFLQLFAQSAFIMEDIVTRICKIYNKKCIVTIRGGAFIDFYNSKPLWCARVLKRATLITTPSLFIQSELTKKGFEVIYIPNHINIDAFPYIWKCKEDSYKLLWVRAFHDIYNPKLAINCIKNLRQVIPNISLTMIGPDQGMLQECLQIICQNSLEPYINIVGPIPNDQLFKYYQSHDVFITTTNYESFGVAIIEAANVGIPMVSTCVGEIPFIWEDNQDILLAEQFNQEEFDKKVKQLLLDKELQKKLSIKAKIKAQRYNWKEIESSWLNLINQ